MAYEIINWKSKGETGATPINRDNLRHMDNGILNVDTYKAEIMPLLTVSDTAPVECERGDLYYNTTTELIYVATQPNMWSEEGATPSTFNLYVDLSSSKLYYYDGTNFNSYGSGGGGDTLPIGIILPFSDDTIPEGYMLCDGRAISRTTYSRLFSIIGTTYGEGDGSTTFNIPNLKGKVPVGYDSTDSDFDALGETGGEKGHMHYNGISAYNNQLTVSNINSDSSRSASELYTVAGTNGFNNVGTQNVYAYSTESGSSLQPYQVVNYIIKVLNAQNGEVRSESLPVGTELDFDGTSQDIPTGWEEVQETVLRKELTADASGNASINWQNLGDLYLDLTPGTWFVKANAYFITTGTGVGYNKSCLSTNITGSAHDRLDSTADMFSSSLNSDFASTHNLSCVVSVSTTTRIYLLESFAYTGNNSSITLRYDTSTTTLGLSFIEARKLN